MEPLMSRRQALCALTFSLATGAFALGGCGGGKRRSSGSSSSPTPTPSSGSTPSSPSTPNTPSTTLLSTESFAGRVELPTGLTATGLTVSALLTSVPLAADSTFQVNFLSGNGPMAAHVLDADKKVVLMGWLRYGATSLSTRTTAEVLTYYGLGGWMLPPDARVAVVNQLAQADLKAVDAAVTTAIAASGTNWLQADLTSVQSAVTDAAKRLRPAPTSDRSRSRALSVRNSTHPATRGVLLAPTDAQSGIQIDSNDLDGFSAVNNYRRRARLFVERVSIRKDGTDTPSPQKFPVVDLSPVSAATSVLFDLASALGGASYYEPTRSDFISTPNADGASATTYRVTGIGIGVQAGKYANLTQEQKDSLRDLAYKTIIIDFLVPIIINLVIPLAEKRIDDFLWATGGNGVLKDAIQSVAATAPAIWEKVQQGNTREAIVDALDYLRTSYTLQTAIFETLNDFIDQNTSLEKVPTAGIVMKVTDAISSALKGPGLILQAIDTGLQALSIGQSTLADTWDLTVTKPTIRVSPKDVTLDPLGSTQTFEVNIGDDGDQSGNVFEYQWASTAQYGTLRATRGDGTDNFTVGQDEVGNTNNTVVYTTNNTGGSGETDTLTVTVYRKSVRDAGADRQLLGTATVKVHIKKQFVLQVSPTQTDINADGTLGLSAYFDPVLPPGTSVKYEWRATGKGTLTGATSDGNASEATVTYHAPSTEGTETVNVIANITRPGTNFTFATNSATATINVKKGLKQVTLSGHWTIEESFYKDGDNDRVSSVAFLVIPKVKDAISYAITADGFNDTAYYQKSLSRTINPDYLGDNQDRGGAIWSGLSGAFSPASSAGDNRNWFNSRFGGMQVKVVVTLKA